MSSPLNTDHPLDTVSDIYSDLVCLDALVAAAISEWEGAEFDRHGPFDPLFYRISREVRDLQRRTAAAISVLSEQERGKPSNAASRGTTTVTR
jgi:hypothetical protein